MSVAIDCCLQCGKSRAQVKDYLDSPCATASGYEVVEGLDDWPRHHWRDWSDRELAGFMVLPEAFHKYRRASFYDFEWVDCADSVHGHWPAKEAGEWWAKNECVRCGLKDAA